MLGWAPRKPLVAPCDRPRVLHLWAQQLAQQQVEQQQQQQRRRRRGRSDSPSGEQDSAESATQPSSSSQVESMQAVQLVPVRQRYIPFAAIRSLSPEVFVDHIKTDFKASGVVSGVNYRFGEQMALSQLHREVALQSTAASISKAHTASSVTRHVAECTSSTAGGWRSAAQVHHPRAAALALMPLKVRSLNELKLTNVVCIKCNPAAFTAASLAWRSFSAHCGLCVSVLSQGTVLLVTPPCYSSCVGQWAYLCQL